MTDQASITPPKKMSAAALLTQKMNKVLDIKTALLTFAGLCGVLVVVSGVTLVMATGTPENGAPATMKNFVVTDKVVGTLDVPAPAEDTHQQDPHNQNPNELSVHESSKPKTVIFVEKEDGLTEDSPYGPLPIIRASDGLTAFKAYQPQYESLSSAAEKSHKVALVLEAYGLSEKLAEEGNKVLPSGITYVLSPYAADPQKQTNAARALGHEVWLGIPVQGTRFGYDDPGPQALLAGLTPENNRKRLDMNLGKATGYVGVAFDTVTAFSAAPTTLGEIVHNLQKRGLAISLLAPERKDLIASELENSLPFLSSGFSLEVNAQTLSNLKVLALSQPCTIATFSASPKALEALSVWAKDEKELEFTPLSRMADCPELHE